MDSTPLSSKAQLPRSLDSAASALEAPFVIRVYREGDHATASRLYREGLLTGQLDPYDLATDLEHIAGVYLRDCRNHFWVAEAHGLVIGTIGILQDPQQEDVAHVRRLRVEPAWQHDPRVAGRLLEAAAAHARAQAFLKLALHTPVDDHRARALLGHLGFVFARRRELHGRPVLEFYRQLYANPPSVDHMAAEAWRLT